MKDATNGRRRFVATAGFAAVAAAFGEVLTGREVRADDDRDVDKFIRAVQRARIFDLSHTWDENSPIASVNPPYAMELNATHENTRRHFGDGRAFLHLGDPAVERPARRSEHRRDRPHRPQRAALRRRRRGRRHQRPARHRTRPERRRRAPRHRALSQGPPGQPRRAARRGAPRATAIREPLDARSTSPTTSSPTLRAARA